MSFIIRNKKFKRPGYREIALIQGGPDNGKKVYVNDTIDGVKELKLSSGNFQPLPSKQDGIVEKLYISGVSGSGKSTYISKWITQFLKGERRDTPIYIFSSVDFDKAFDEKFGESIIRIDLDASLVTNPIEVPELADSLCIFDDIDTVKHPAIRKAVCSLRDECLEIGRHYNVRLLCTSHILSNWGSTRRLLNEATSVTVFPKGGGGLFHIKNYLKTYAGMSTNQIKKLINLKSRWVTIYRVYNPYIISQKEIYFNRDEDLE
tara:strand:+ start:786 stop:1571 length:786 start_codon:yes stop_codon:yes gene_type:complete